VESRALLISDHLGCGTIHMQGLDELSRAKAYFNSEYSSNSEPPMIVLAILRTI
jgi:hypothetical protein